MIEKEVVVEIWRTENYTCTVVYPYPSVAVVKGFRGKYTKEIAKEIRNELSSLGITKATYERRKPNGDVNYFEVDVKQDKL